jgi:hypothetical protein
MILVLNTDEAVAKFTKASASGSGRGCVGGRGQGGRWRRLDTTNLKKDIVSFILARRD